MGVEGINHAPLGALNNTPNGPIPLFDQNLRALGDSYLTFFSERIRIEEGYVDALLRLHRQTRALDNLIDDRSEPTTLRQAWREVRDNLEREAETRTAFLNSLRVDIVPALTTLKETQERTRKRIKEDLKDSMNAHLDYQENVLPKLKKAYLKRSQDVDDFKAGSAAAFTSSPQPQAYSAPRTTSPTRQSMDIPPPLDRDRDRYSQPPSYTDSSTIQAPLPSAPRSSANPNANTGSVPNSQGAPGSPRNRSPSTSTSLSDLAQHGKKGLGHIMGFLDKDRPERTGAGPGGGGGGGGGSMPAPREVREISEKERGNNALKGVKAKRDADEADKEYRKGVHWLETLRLRRMKILEAGYKSLELFLGEMGTTMQKSLEAYVDSLIATSTTTTQLGHHAQSQLAYVNTAKDLASIQARVPQQLARATPPRVPYYNYAVGDCNDLVFGVSLVDYSTSHHLNDGEIPLLLEKCIREVDKRGLETEGIYRVSGRHAIVQELTHRIERNERQFEFNHGTDDVYCVAAIIKLYLRELPEPLFKFAIQERIQHTEDREEHVQNNFLLLRSKLRRLPVIHQSTLRAVLEHLGRVASKSTINKMDAKNLAVVFGVVIFGEDEIPKGDLLSIQNWKDTVMGDLITFHGLLFDDNKPVTAPIRNPSPRPPSPPSPKLPAAPPGPPPPVEFGSSFTKITTLPPRGANEDFSPQMPQRPPQSIHPSRRPQQQQQLPVIKPPSPPPPHNPPQISESRSVEGTPRPSKLNLAHDSQETATPKVPTNDSVSSLDPSVAESPHDYSTAVSSPVTSDHQNSK